MFAYQEKKSASKAEKPCNDKTLKRNPKPVVQRMSFFEGMDNGEPNIVRYKRTGWIAFEDLKEFFTEDSLKNCTVGELHKVLNKILTLISNAQCYRIINANESLEYSDNFKNILEKYKPGSYNIPLNTSIAKLKNIFNTFSKIRETLKDGENTPLEEIKTVGNYESVGKIDPYYNYKKIAIHCIACKAMLDSKSDLGPHVAIAILGKRIYIANNTHYVSEGRPLADMEVLFTAVKNAIKNISLENIKDIMKKGSFESGMDKNKITEEEKKKAYQWIQGLRNYAIIILDLPQYRAKDYNPASNQNSSNKDESNGVRAIHGEMTIMDYLKNEKNNLRNTTDGRTRVIMLGGTKVDCKKCHDYFETSRTDIDGNYVISSKTHGDKFNGTDEGTHPSLLTNDNAEIVKTDLLELVYSRTLKHLDEIISKLRSGIQYENLSSEDQQLVSEWFLKINRMSELLKAKKQNRKLAILTYEDIAAKDRKLVPELTSISHINKNFTIISEQDVEKIESRIDEIFYLSIFGDEEYPPHAEDMMHPAQHSGPRIGYMNAKTSFWDCE